LKKRQAGTQAVRGGRRIATGLVLVTLTLAAMTAYRTTPVAAFGPVAEQAILLQAIETLPKQLKPFYKEHRLEMPTLSPEATAAEKTPDRRFAIDRLMPFPFADLPRSEAEMKKRFGDPGGEIGRLPWLVQESYARLALAFKSRDKTKILEESDALASLVAEIHNPLALTDNGDGQKTGQHGLWIRFSQRLPEAMEKKLNLNPDAAIYLDDPKEYVFSMIGASYVWLDNILYLEELAKRGKGGYTEAYYEDLARRAGPVLRERLSHAAEDVGSYWYTAWTAGGRPEVK
jgi:hypothetical protein